MTSASAKDLAERLIARAESWRTLAGNYLYYGKPEATVDEAAAALLTRYAEVEGELETTEEWRATLKAKWERSPRGHAGLSLIRDLIRLTAQVAALKEERDAAEEIVSEAINELHCCDDIPLQTGLVEGIETLRKDRDALNADRYAIGCNRDDWRERAMAAEAELDAANARAERLAGALRTAQRCFRRMPIQPSDYDKAEAIIDAALLTEPEAKGGDPAPVPATTEKTDD